jgi:hypothetical protein
MESEQHIFTDSKVKIGRRQWVVAIGKVSVQVLEAADIHPTIESLLTYLSNPNPVFRQELDSAAYSYVETEYELFLEEARRLGFKGKKAESAAKKVLKAKYKQIDKDNERNFFFLDPLVFQTFN